MGTCSCPTDTAGRMPCDFLLSRQHPAADTRRNICRELRHTLRIPPHRRLGRPCDAIGRGARRRPLRTNRRTRTVGVVQRRHGRPSRLPAAAFLAQQPDDDFPRAIRRGSRPHILHRPLGQRHHRHPHRLDAPSTPAPPPLTAPIIHKPINFLIIVAISINNLHHKFLILIFAK